MNIVYHEFYSVHLNRIMPFKAYGHGGKPIIVFPSSGGRFYEYEDFQMIEACKDFINNGDIKIYTVDSIDNESWLNKGSWPGDKANGHNTYDKYITDEFIPFVYNDSGWYGKMGTTGCSMGGFHSANFFFRHPDIFDTVIALSGIYDARFFIGGDIVDKEVYLNSPIDYLKNQNDDYLNAYRGSNIIICTGQGNWEADSIRDSQLLEEVLRQKNIPSWVDYWGYDVDHDWPWWRVQIQYFLSSLKNHGKL